MDINDKVSLTSYADLIHLVVFNEEAGYSAQLSVEEALKLAAFLQHHAVRIMSEDC